MTRPALARVALYRRRLPVPVERVWENVRDWEHLPWLHRASFAWVACEGAGAWGWRARIGLPGGSAIRLELAIEPDAPRYVARTLEGPGSGSEIWTRVAERGEHSEVEVEFWLPGVAAAQADAIGASYTQLYTRLWDEDESMMLRRARELARGQPAARAAPRALGPLAALREALPLCVGWAGATWRIVALRGALVAHATRCPHRLGPLEHAPVDADGCVTCPWHGWRFDLATGASADGRGARLATAPRVEVDAGGQVWLRPADAARG